MPAHAARGRLLEIIAAFTASDSPTEIVGLSLFSGCVQLRYDAAHHELFFTGNATAGAYRSTALTLAPGGEFEAISAIGEVEASSGLQVWPLRPTVVFDPPPGSNNQDVR